MCTNTCLCTFIYLCVYACGKAQRAYVAYVCIFVSVCLFVSSNSLCRYLFFTHYNIIYIFKIICQAEHYHFLCAAPPETQTNIMYVQRSTYIKCNACTCTHDTFARTLEYTWACIHVRRHKNTGPLSWTALILPCRVNVSSLSSESTVRRVRSAMMGDN